MVFKDLDIKVKRGIDAVFTVGALLAGWVFVAKYDAALYQEKGNAIILYVTVISLVSLGIIAFFQRIFIAPAAIIISLVFCGIYDANTSGVLIKKGDITIAEWVAFISAVITLCFFAVRLKHQSEQVDAQNRQIKNQIEQNIDQMFNAAVALLGSSETSARTGAIYSLYHLALDNAKYRAQIAQILCSHIRSKTREKDTYQEEHKHAPSNEIQTTINLLFKNVLGQEGLYCKHNSDLPRADLSYAYLAGAKFGKAFCEGANFRNAHCEGAYFGGAKCEGVNFAWAHCEGAYFIEAHCEGAYFGWAHCEGARFMDAHCEGAYFIRAHCEGATFEKAHCEGATFIWAHCEGADFRNAHCEGADFTQTNCQGANFISAYCQGTYAYLMIDAKHRKLVCRINKKTEFCDMIVSRGFDDNSINSIEQTKKNAEKFLPKNWYSTMQKLINENSGKFPAYGCPARIEVGTLSDESGKLLALAEKLEKIEKQMRNAYA